MSCGGASSRHAGGGGGAAAFDGGCGWVGRCFADSACGAMEECIDGGRDGGRAAPDRGAAFEISCGAADQGGCLMREFAVWAPRVNRCRVQVGDVVHAMKAGEHGWWRAEVEDAVHGDDYGF